jgi:hypothetical protein
MGGVEPEGIATNNCYKPKKKTRGPLQAVFNEQYTSQSR